MEEEKKKLVRGLIVCFILILVLCRGSMYFASLSAEAPTYDEKEMKGVISYLKESSYTIEKKERTTIELFFNVYGITNAFFTLESYGLDLVLTDDINYYLFPFREEVGRLLFFDPSTSTSFVLFLYEDNPVIQRDDGDLLEFD